MYCRKCGKDYPKSRKVCKECGTALTPGKSPGKKNKSNTKMIVIGGSILAIILAFFLIIGVGGMLPQQLKGTWRDQGGLMGTVEFKPGGVVEWSAGSDSTYSYNAGTGQGTITADGGAHPFTCDGNTLILDGATYIK
jgi:predicted nucleic acid-binding Zn ribbon protein